MNVVLIISHPCVIGLCLPTLIIMELNPWEFKKYETNTIAI